MCLAQGPNTVPLVRIEPTTSGAEIRRSIYAKYPISKSKVNDKKLCLVIYLVSEMALIENRM